MMDADANVSRRIERGQLQTLFCGLNALVLF